MEQAKISRSIFITNIFAERHPMEHTVLWNNFIKDVPENRRTGYYGADNVAYIRYLKQIKSPIFNQFIQENISMQTA